jgi:hypothetical protein
MDPRSGGDNQVQLYVTVNTADYNSEFSDPDATPVTGVGDKAAIKLPTTGSSGYHYNQLGVVKGGVFVRLKAGGPLVGQAAQTAMLADMAQIFQRLGA